MPETTGSGNPVSVREVTLREGAARACAASEDLHVGQESILLHSSENLLFSLD